LEASGSSVILPVMLTISLKDFITTGKFGPIELGMTIEQVKEILGEPEMWTGPDFTPGHGIIVYAWYEFFYFTETRAVYGIQNDHLATMPNPITGRVNNKRDICFTNELFTIDTWFLKKNRYMTYEQVIDRLDKDGISYTMNWEHGYIKLTLQSGVYIVFDDLDERSVYHEELGEWEHPASVEAPDRHVLTGISHFDIRALLP
jgi:hypothetical protein